MLPVSCCHLPTDWHSGENAKALSQSAPLSTFLCNHFHSQGYMQSEILLLHWHFGRCCIIQGNYRASRFCWNSATRESNALVLAKSQHQVGEPLSSHSLHSSGAHHSACSYLLETTDSVYLEKLRQVLKQSVRPQTCAEVPPWKCPREVAISTNIHLPVKK